MLRLVAIGAIIVVIAAIFVYSGRYNKISVTKDFTIETNIPRAPRDTSLI